MKHSEIELHEAQRALRSLLNKCEKIDADRLGKAQQTLLKRRIAALQVAVELIEKEQLELKGRQQNEGQQ